MMEISLPLKNLENEKSHRHDTNHHHHHLHLDSFPTERNKFNIEIYFIKINLLGITRVFLTGLRLIMMRVGVQEVVLIVSS